MLIEDSTTSIEISERKVQVRDYHETGTFPLTISLGTSTGVAISSRSPFEVKLSSGSQCCLRESIGSQSGVSHNQGVNRG